MSSTAPHFLLLTRANSASDRYPVGQWSFVLERFGDMRRTEVVDEEPGVQGERLELLAVVRGLEALEQPSRVTLVTASNYVGRGMRSGLKQWVENDFKWKRFGELTPVKNSDLWRRIARALTFHVVDCRVWQFESASHPQRRMSLPSLIRPETSVDRGGFPGDFAGISDESDSNSADTYAEAGGQSVVGQHAARAGIVYRHYAARNQSGRIQTIGQAGETGLCAIETTGRDGEPADAGSLPGQTRRRRQAGTRHWSKVTSRVSAKLEAFGLDKSNHQPEPAYA